MDTLEMLKRIGDIIQHELDLADDQAYVYNQKFTIPSDLRVYFPIKYTSGKVFGNNVEYEDQGGSELVEIVKQNIQAVVTIDILSKSVIPIDTQNDVLAALRGTYSQQIQQKYGFMIAIVPQNIIPINEEDGAAILYRFNFPIVVQYATKREKGVDSYNNFSHTILEES